MLYNLFLQHRCGIAIMLLISLCTISKTQSQDSAQIGLYVGVNLSSFSRSQSLPVKPLSENYLLGYEAGLHLPLTDNKNYQALLLIGYAQSGGKEIFRFNDQILESELKFQSVKSSLLPIILKFGSQNFKVLFGGGGYLQYNLSNSFSSDPQVEFVQQDDLITKLIYGAQARVGLIYKSWSLTADAYNSINNLINLATDDTIIFRGVTVSISKTFGPKTVNELPNN